MTTLPRSRLSEERSLLLPFYRATGLKDISLYWLPVFRFPILPPQKTWLLEFMRRLDTEFGKEKLRPETFLQFKSLYPYLLNRFLETSMDYQPMTGVGLEPGGPLPEPLTIESLQTEIDKGGLVDVKQWMLNYCHWFMTKQAQQQRADFLGIGGMCMLWVQATPDMPPPMELPRIVRTHPQFVAMKGEEKMAGLASLEDPFLAKLKETFGEPLRSDPSYPGMMFVLPLFHSAALLQSTAKERELWFQCFEAYLIESVKDKGVLFAVGKPDFDEQLIQILETMRDDGLSYPELSPVR